MLNSPTVKAASVQEQAKSLLISSRAKALTLNIPLVYDYIQTGGYYTNGDGGGTEYKRVSSDPGTTGKFQDNTGAWFELVNNGGAANIKWFGAKGDGLTNDRSAIVDAITFNNKGAIYAPAGNYLVTASIVTVNTVNVFGIFSPGLKVYGDGIDVTSFLYSGNDGFLFDVSVADFATQKVMNCEFKNFTIKRSGSPASNNGGIKLRAAYMAVIDHVRISNLRGDGINAVSTLTDIDGCGWLTISNCFIELCTGWGVNAGSSADGDGSLSFLHIDQSWIQYCGVTSGAYLPPSGGMTWKGLIGLMTNCGFTLNYNVALYLPGRGTRFTIDNTDFENSHYRAVFSRGIQGFVMRNCELLSNLIGPTAFFVEFEAGTYVVKDVDIKNSVVRAYNGYAIPTTAFKISGVNADLDTCRVVNTYWMDFDYPGQVRFDGWRFDQVEDNNYLTVLNSSTLSLRPLEYGKGNTIPMRLVGPAAQSPGGAPSTTGEWVTGRIAVSGLELAAPADSVAAMRYIYAYDSGGLIRSPLLEHSTTVPTVSVNALTGYRVKTGDATKFYIGRWMTDASGNWITTGTGYLNPTRLRGSNLLGFMWRDAGGIVRVSNSEPATDTSGTALN